MLTSELGNGDNTEEIYFGYRGDTVANLVHLLFVYVQ